MGQMLVFPGLRTPPPQCTRPGIPARRRTDTAREHGHLVATGGRRGEYALADIARQLRLLHRPVRAIIATLRALAEHDGMPLPRSPRILSGRPVTGPRMIWRNSRWDAGEIDAWLDGRGPAAPAMPAAPRAASPHLRAEMERRAAGIAVSA